MLNTFRAIWNGIALFAVFFSVFMGYMYFQQKDTSTGSNMTVNIGPTILQEIRRVNKQVFIEQYNAVTVTYQEAPESWFDLLKKLGIRKEFVVVVRGKVAAGFDLSSMSEKDIWVSGDKSRAQITLPQPIIFVDDVVIDLSDSQVLSKSDHCPDFLCKDELTAYKDIILPEAKKQLIEFAQRSDILDRVATEGRDYYQGLFDALDIAEMRVVVNGYSQD